MKQLEKDVVKDLISFYSNYVESDLTEEVKEHAKIIEGKYLQSSTLISDDVFQLVGGLVNFYAPTNIKPLSVNSAKEKLIFLKKRLKELSH